MKRIQLLPFGSVPGELLAELCRGLSHEFAVPCKMLNPEPDPVFAYNVARKQYHSTEILATLMRRTAAENCHTLGVTLFDLYIPILTFVFGEAQLQGTCAVVSAHRLHQEFYGLPADPSLLSERLLKEAVHEMGHTLALSHCEDYQCVMAASHGVEWIDLKTSRFCPACRAVVQSHASIKAAL
ncbi:MAG TPA: archaemetzincin family Zn-dependent metalloprotease [Candidatus Limnocylindrales bacterium]|nr:archaemetzincin family Zn-dependent metalloprotease [Candidatus Limnocylindrales bacterium]